MSRFVDLSHPVTQGTAYPGLPGPTVTEYTGRSESAHAWAPASRSTSDRSRLIDANVAMVGIYRTTPCSRAQRSSSAAASSGVSGPRSSRSSLR